MIRFVIAGLLIALFLTGVLYFILKYFTPVGRKVNKKEKKMFKTWSKFWK